MFGLAGLLRAPPTKQDLVCAVQTVLSRAFAFTELDTHASASMDSAVPTTHGRNEDLGQDKSRGKRLTVAATWSAAAWGWRLHQSWATILSSSKKKSFQCSNAW